MRSRYEIKIINLLLDKFESSKVSKGINLTNRSISLLFDEKNMIDYVGENSYKYEKEIEVAVVNLENNQFVFVDRNSDNRIVRVILNLDNVMKCYSYVNRDSLKEKKQGIDNVLDKYANKGKLVEFFRSKIKKREASYLSNKKYFTSENELEEILLVLDKLDNQVDEISRRSFSAKYLKDSKRLETILSKIESIIRECDGIDLDDVLVKYNVYKNPSFVYLKGIGRFKVNNQIIDLVDLDSELILSSNHIRNLEVLSLDCKEIVTVENLTSFYEYPSNNRCVIYLGGFHNEIRKKLLISIYNFKPSLIFYHSGDIDAGGFYILRHLMIDTQINFVAKMMDVNTLCNYENDCIKLSERDRERLGFLRNDNIMSSYFDVIDYMLAKNIKLEQENIEYD